MSISLTFTAETADDLHRQVAEWAGRPTIGKQAKKSVAEQKSEAAVLSVDAPVLTPELLEVVSIPLAVVDAETATPSSTPTAEEPTAATADAPSTDGVPEYPIVREKVLQLAVAKGPETVRDLLSSKYGVVKASDLDPSRWNALLTDVALAMG